MKLVYMLDNKPVTDSLTVSEVFDKRHDRVLQDIRQLKCSGEFRLHHFVESHYTNQQGREMPKFYMTEQGFTLLVMGYTGERAMEFKEMYINEFHKMREHSQLHKPKSQAELMLMYAQQFVDMENRVSQVEQTVTTIKDTIIQRDDDWRKWINKMFNNAVMHTPEKNFRSIRNESYLILEERARCKLDTRLRNLKIRLSEEGATKTKINSTSKLDVIEAEPRLKEIYTSIVKELSIKLVQAVN